MKNKKLISLMAAVSMIMSMSTGFVVAHAENDSVGAGDGIGTWTNNTNENVVVTHNEGITTLSIADMTKLSTDYTKPSYVDFNITNPIVDNSTKVKISYEFNIDKDIFTAGMRGAQQLRIGESYPILNAYTNPRLNRSFYDNNTDNYFYLSEIMTGWKDTNDYKQKNWLSTNTWNTIEYVFDVDAEGKTSICYATIGDYSGALDGASNLVEGYYDATFDALKFGFVNPNNVSGYANATEDVTIQIKNIEIEQVGAENSLTVTGNKQTGTLTFSEAVDDTILDSIKVKDSTGNEAAAVTKAASGKTVTLSNLAFGSTYTVTVDEGAKSAWGATLEKAFEIQVITPSRETLSGTWAVLDKKGKDRITHNYNETTDTHTITFTNKSNGTTANDRASVGYLLDLDENTNGFVGVAGDTATSAYVEVSYDYIVDDNMKDLTSNISAHEGFVVNNGIGDNLGYQVSGSVAVYMPFSQPKACQLTGDTVTIPVSDEGKNTLQANKWHNVKFIYEVTYTRCDTTNSNYYYADVKMVKAVIDNNVTNLSVYKQDLKYGIRGLGFNFLGSSTLSSDTVGTLQLKNFKVERTAGSFDVTVAEDFVLTDAGNTVDLSFTNEVTQNALADIVVLDKNYNEVAGAITKAELTNSGYGATLTIGGVNDGSYYLSFKNLLDKENECSSVELVKFYYASNGLAISDAVLNESTVTVNFVNETGSAQSGILIAAAYDANNKMIDAALVNNVTISTGTDSETATFDTAPTTAAGIKVFVWDSVNSLKPLCQAGKFDIE